MAKNEQFAFPPLVEVAFEITFAPRLKVREKLSDFQDKIVKDYPSFEAELPPITGASLPENLQERYKFQTTSAKRFIRVAIDRFNIVEQQYASFQSFSGEVLKKWGILDQLIGPITPTRIGLRYVNKLLIRSRKDSFNLNKYVKPYHDTGKFEDDDVASVRQEARILRDGCHLSIRSGIAGYEEQPSSLVYILDYDCYREGEEIRGTIQAQLKKLHSIIETQFLNDLKDPYIKYMRTGKWA